MKDFMFSQHRFHVGSGHLHNLVSRILVSSIFLNYRLNGLMDVGKLLKVVIPLFPINQTRFSFFQYLFS